MKHGQDKNAAWLRAKMDQVGEPLQGNAPDIFIDEWVSKRIVCGERNSLLNFGQELQTESLPFLLIPAGGIGDMAACGG